MVGWYEDPLVEREEDEYTGGMAGVGGERWVMVGYWV